MKLNDTFLNFQLSILLLRILNIIQLKIFISTTLTHAMFRKESKKAKTANEKIKNKIKHKGFPKAK